MIKWLIIFLFFYNQVKAQVTFTGNTSHPIELGNSFELKTPENPNQYLISKWSAGSLHYLNGTSKMYDSLNFERYANYIELVSNNKLLTLMPMGLIGVVINNSTNAAYILLVATINSESKFLNINSIGKYILGSYLVVDEPPENQTYAIDELRFAPKAKANLIIKEKFTLLTDEVWNPFKLSKSSIGKLFGVDKKELQKIASQHNLSVNDQEGLVKLFQLLNAK